MLSSAYIRSVSEPECVTGQAAYVYASAWCRQRERAGAWCVYEGGTRLSVAHRRGFSSSSLLPNIAVVCCKCIHPRPAALGSVGHHALGVLLSLGERQGRVDRELCVTPGSNPVCQLGKVTL